MILSLGGEKRQKNHIATNKCIWNGTYLVVSVIDFLLKCQRNHPVSSVPPACHLCFEKAVMRRRSWLGCFDCYAPPLGGRATSHIIFHPRSSAFYPDQELAGCARQPGHFQIHFFVGGNINLTCQKHSFIPASYLRKQRPWKWCEVPRITQSPPSQHHTWSEC